MRKLKDDKVRTLDQEHLRAKDALQVADEMTDVALCPQAVRAIRRSISHGLFLAVQVHRARVAREYAEISKNPWPEDLNPVYPMESLAESVAPMADALLWLDGAQEVVE